MKKQDKYLLVASFLEAKNFPKRAKTQLIVEAKFDDAQLSSDPVEHNENLEINQELAWELDRKALQQHKLQRSVIKVNCCAITGDLNKENVGYFVLDIRSAPEGIGKPKWYTLLQTKYAKSKPEIKVNIYIEADQSNADNQDTQEKAHSPVKKNKETKIVSVDSPYKGGGVIDSKKLRPMYVESEGYFALGPESHNSEVFLLSVAIMHFKNLVALFPADFNLNEVNEFSFEYDLLGQRVSTQPFNNLLSEQVNTERASVRLLTTCEILRAFILGQKQIEVYFCANGNKIAKGMLNMGNIYREENVDLKAKPVQHDEEIQLVPLKLKPKSDEDALIGIQVLVRRENQQATITLENEIEALEVNERAHLMKTPDLTPIKHVNRLERTPSPSNRQNNLMSTMTKGPVVNTNCSNGISANSVPGNKMTFTVNSNANGNGNGNNNNWQEEENRLHEEMQLRVAFELQLWKEAREKEFEQYLKKLETQKLSELAEAFKKRDREREALVQKKFKEYQDLEEKLKNSFNELGKREKNLANNEAQITRIKSDLQREYELKLNEIREVSKRVQEQAEHQINLQRMKCEALEEEITKLKKQVLEAEKRYADKDAEFIRYKERENSKPEVRLQAEINLLNLEKNELERKLEAATRSRAQYKEQWIKALDEIAMMKKREEANAKAMLKKEKMELDHMRMRYKAAEENNLIKNEEKNLDSLKSELNKLKTTVEKTTFENDDDYIDENVEQHIARLIEERDTLLSTGIYSHRDTVIIELDRQIKEAMNQVKK